MLGLRKGKGITEFKEIIFLLKLSRDGLSNFIECQTKNLGVGGSFLLELAISIKIFVDFFPQICLNFLKIILRGLMDLANAREWKNTNEVGGKWTNSEHYCI